MTRDERLQWCKDRALTHLDQGDCIQAHASFISDTAKDFDGRDPVVDWGAPAAVAIAPLAIGYMMERDTVQLRRWIEG